MRKCGLIAPQHCQSKGPPQARTGGCARDSLEEGASSLGTPVLHCRIVTSRGWVTTCLERGSFAPLLLLV